MPLCAGSMNISPALSEPPDIILTELAGLRTRSGDATESRGRNMVTAVDISQILIKTGRQEIAFRKKMDVTENKYTIIQPQGALDKRNFP